MGRAMLIICAGVLVSLGFVAMGTQQQGRNIIKNNAGYAEFTQAKNRAHTAIQMSFQEMNQDPNWAANHGKSNPWYPTIEGQTVELYVDVFADDTAYFGIDSVRIFSSAIYGENSLDTAKVISVYNRNEIDLVPDFEGAVTISSEYAKITTNGSAGINGNNTSCPGNMPGITANNQTAYDEAVNGTSGMDLTGDPAIKKDTTISYQPTDDLIARLEGLSTVTKITDNYKEQMGTADNPGVFFVDQSVKLTGGIGDGNGYGIMVVRTGGEILLEDSTGTLLDLAGNFTFHGLVIFENAYNFKGRGTPTINGSVLVGNSEDYCTAESSEPCQDLNIDFSGNIQINYDCQGEDYANRAAAMAFQQGQYKRIVTFD